MEFEHLTLAVPDRHPRGNNVGGGVCESGTQGGLLWDVSLSLWAHRWYFNEAGSDHLGRGFR